MKKRKTNKTLTGRPNSAQQGPLAVPPLHPLPSFSLTHGPALGPRLLLPGHATAAQARGAPSTRAAVRLPRADRVPSDPDVKEHSIGDRFPSLLSPHSL
jgi:hypothetical protein